MADSSKFCSKLSVIFTGRVQGVGFRMTVVEIAKDFEVTGEIYNVSNGTVEMKAFGDEEELFRFLRAIQMRFKRNIINLWQDLENNVSADQPMSGGFCIRSDKID